MKRIALAGGIGAGKSTVVDYLRALEYLAIDADEVYRDLTAIGQPLVATLTDAFGRAILTPEGELDRPFVASVVFSDPTALLRLNAITHGTIGRELRRQMDAADAKVVFVTIPLFRGEHRAQLGIDEMWSVQVNPEVAVERLVQQRGMSENSARARIDNQVSNAEREAMADEVIWNNTDRDALRSRIDELLRERGLDGY